MSEELMLGHYVCEFCTEMEFCDNCDVKLIIRLELTDFHFYELLKELFYGYLRKKSIDRKT